MELKRQPAVLKEMRKSCLRSKPNCFKMGLFRKKKDTSEKTAGGENLYTQHRRAGKMKPNVSEETLINVR